MKHQILGQKENNIKHSNKMIKLQRELISGSYIANPVRTER